MAHAKRETASGLRSPSPFISSLSSDEEEEKETINVPFVTRHRSSSVSSLSSTQSISTKAKWFFHGIHCYKINCPFDHPDKWNPCKDGAQCDNYECTAKHPPERRAKCKDGNKCHQSNCKRLHPIARARRCPSGAKCQTWNCFMLHPRSRACLCTDKENCTNLTCLCLHPPERAKLLCSVGADCCDLLCKRNHPPERPTICDQPSTCPNFYCTRLHELNWNPWEVEYECEYQQYSKIHSSEGNTNLQKQNAAVVTSGKKKSKISAKYLKNFEQRMKDRNKTQLPILSWRSEFCRRLKNERMLVVTAETGSGKSTQLPQYAAEEFDSLVVCTQPRVVAALSLARRVAEEYDGKSVGESVGYQVGNDNRVPGTSIMFMTDGALIRESQRDPSLKHVRVLIIDEAHERSLNTDIVIGISKLLLTQRPDDFYVVIASATIDPTHFLRFYGRSTNAYLQVPGRVFPVTVVNKPPSPDCSYQKLIESHIVPSIIELYPHHEGHTLVFLPGQGEVEKSLSVFKSRVPSNCVSLPLYGSQSPEEQEKVIKFDKKEKRMVVFCTNVAETSITIPNVRLVIDSGWAKEARYDVKRRLTVIETVRISRSSADQRKGRAGRTAPGHCIRLYEDAELIRTNIEPEILRSSLDLALLQLIRLGIDPTTFPFMDQPRHDIISNSVDLLRRLKCVDDKRITQRGELFAELGLDPRFSAFIVEIYLEYDSLLEVTVAIVAILSAPGTIFFMGGATKNTKEQAKMRVALGANSHQSDLIYFYSVYKAWKEAGTKQTQGNCTACNQKVKWCICRIRYSNEEGLNNKILQNIHGSCTSMIKQIKNAHWLKSGNAMPKNLVDIIGIRLARLFPEQYGYLLVPKLPTEGVRLISTDVRASISSTSVFMQKLHFDANQTPYQYFIAMNITQLPSGKYIVERLHSIPKTEAISQSPIQTLMTIENISSELFHQIRQKMNVYQMESWAKWLVYQYDRPRCRFIIWGLDTDKSKVETVVRSIREEILKQFSDTYELLECGPIKASFRGGLICTHINKMTSPLRLELRNVPKQTLDQLKLWLKKNIDVEWREIKTYGYNSAIVDQDKKDKEDSEKQYLYLIFKHEEVFRQARNKVPPYYLNEQGNAFVNHQDNERETWGRELVVQTPGNVSVQDVINHYGEDCIVKCIHINEKQRVESSLKLNNLPLSADKASLEQCLQRSNGPTPKHIYVGRESNNLTEWAKVTFVDEGQRNKAAVIYNMELCQNPFTITVIGKKGLKQKLVYTKVENGDDANASLNQSISLAKNRFRLIFINREATSDIFSSQSTITTKLDTAIPVPEPIDVSEWTIDSSATVNVLRTDLYPDFQQTIDRVCDKFGVQVKSKAIPNHGKRFTFSQGSPQKTSLAASMVARTFAPMKIKLNNDRQKQLFSELEQVGEIQKWAHELHLDIYNNKWNTNIEIRGPQIAQGQLMRRIADYSDNFNERFREYELSASTAAFFGRNKAASVKLQQIASKWLSKSCSVSFVPKTSTIIIIGKPQALSVDIDDCEDEVSLLLKEITATAHDEDSTEEEDDDDDDDNDNDIDVESHLISIKGVQQHRQCVFCNKKSSISISFFRNCGHAYCQCAAQALSTPVSFPLQCKQCKSDIHILDIQIIFSNNDDLFTRLLKISIQKYLVTNAQQDDRVFCPNEECDGLIARSRGYQICLTCGQCVCPKCQVIDDELHAGRTCVELAEEKKRFEFLAQLFKVARKFVHDNWPLDAAMQPIGRIDENPYLKKHCKSLTRFYNGISTLGHSRPLDLAKGFFAYHGTAFQGIVPICKDGFDPKRRSGQAYGRGEYFGVTASVSHGYCQKGGSQSEFSQMIIAFILRCTQVTTKGNFCYVVDNPTDWKYAFNLPVLVVTYGTIAASQASSFPDVILDFVDDDSSWSTPFRWHWCQDNGQFEAYNDTINQILERYYEQWKFHEGPSTVVTPPITRYLDDIPQSYAIDYSNNRQTNLKTSYRRAIERRRMDDPPVNQQWFYRNENNEWKPFESMVQKSIETAYQSYRSGSKPSNIDIRFPGRPETYRLNFVTGQQTNTTTNVSRNIKRE